MSFRCRPASLPAWQDVPVCYGDAGSASTRLGALLVSRRRDAFRRGSFFTYRSVLPKTLLRRRVLPKLASVFGSTPARGSNGHASGSEDFMNSEGVRFVRRAPSDR